LLKNQEALFRAVSYKQTFDGYLRAYAKYETEEEDRKTVLPDWTEGTSASAAVSSKQCFTQAPQRFNEARLIKEMEDLGIGRPSTYATTVATIRERKYVSFVDKKFIPTEQGRLTIDELDKYFASFVSADYSKTMEIGLDLIAEGQGTQVETIRTFYDFFIPMVEFAGKNMEKVKATETGEICPLCGSPMVFRKGKFGDFEACSNFPKCKYIKPNDTVKKAAAPARTTGVVCPKCHKGTLVERIAGKGKNQGKAFYACNNFPRCKYIAPFQAVGKDCPTCGKPLVEQDGKTYCIDTEECKHQE